MTIAVRADERMLGFEIESAGDLDAEGLGLRDRVEALGGWLSVGSESGHRTRVVGSVPLSG